MDTSGADLCSNLTNSYTLESKQRENMLKAKEL